MSKTAKEIETPMDCGLVLPCREVVVASKGNCKIIRAGGDAGGTYWFLQMDFKNYEHSGWSFLAAGDEEAIVRAEQHLQLNEIKESMHGSVASCPSYTFHFCDGGRGELDYEFEDLGAAVLANLKKAARSRWGE